MNINPHFQTWTCFVPSSPAAMFFHVRKLHPSLLHIFIVKYIIRQPFLVSILFQDRIR